MTWKLVGAAVAVGLAVIAVVLVASTVLGVPADTFTRDPAALAPGLPFYGGSVSLLTSVVWGSLATAAFVAGWLAPRLRRPMVLLGALALLLLTDDALMVHELLAPRVGIPEELVYVGYVAVAAVIAWLLRHDLRSPAGRALTVAGAVLALSVAIDKFVAEAPLVLLAEDGTKLVGALVLLTAPVLALREVRAAATAAAGAATPSSIAPGDDGGTPEPLSVALASPPPAA